MAQTLAHEGSHLKCRRMSRSTGRQPERTSWAMPTRRVTVDFMHDGALVLQELRARYTALVALAEIYANARAINAADIRSTTQRFPGALRELDRIPLAQLRAKLAEVNACRVPALWMQVTYDFTLQLRFELEARAKNDHTKGQIKPATVRGRKPSLDALARTAQRFALTTAEARELALPDSRRR